MERAVAIVDSSLFVTLVHPYLGYDLLEPFDNLLAPRLEAIETFHGKRNLRYLTGAVVQRISKGTSMAPVFDYDYPWPEQVCLPVYRRLREQVLPEARHAARHRMPLRCPRAARLLACLQVDGEDDWRDAYRTCRLAYLAFALARDLKGMEWVRSQVREHVVREMDEPDGYTCGFQSPTIDFGEEMEAFLLEEESRWLRNPFVRISII